MWSSGTWYDVTATSPVNINQWYHFVGTYDGTTQKFYLNGVLIGSRTSTLSYSGLDRILIGATKETSSGALNAFWKGTIDDVRLYNRALSDSEVTALYNSSTAIRQNRPTIISRNYK